MYKIRAGKLSPEKLVEKTINLEEALDELANMDSFRGTGIKLLTDSDINSEIEYRNKNQDIMISL